MPEEIKNEILFNTHQFDEALEKYKQAFTGEEEFTMSHFNSFRKTSQSYMLKNMRIVHCLHCDDDKWTRRRWEANDKVHVTYTLKHLSSIDE